ncbi:MAG: hypothetical protein NUV97_02415 [archaeon]|nr:hypothetical protein [archaeon]MCR4323800.1 hypothetical protein [Nanoarchaeota archaeon]
MGIQKYWEGSRAQSYWKGSRAQRVLDRLTTQEKVTAGIIFAVPYGTIPSLVYIAYKASQVTGPTRASSSDVPRDKESHLKDITEE